jgi:hypothetical protein
MPHNWASAECIRYLRHMLLLEDGGRMRLLEGIVPGTPRAPFRLEHTPTRFGRVNLDLEPIASSGWKLDFTLDLAEHPLSVELPLDIASRRFKRVVGASSRTENSRIMIDPNAKNWTAFWV